MSAWAALVVANAVGVAMLARCFTGPGELLAALATLLAVHLVALSARFGRGSLATAPPGTRGGTLGFGASDPARSGSSWRLVLWPVAVLVGALIPLVIVFGHSFTWGLPLSRTWHLVGHDLGRGWVAYSRRVAPVPELPGLVVASAWAAGACGLVSELLSSSRKVPSLFALVPGVGVFLFASTLGVPSWRPVGLATEAAACVWFLLATARDRRRAGAVEIAVTDVPADAKGRPALAGPAGIILRLSLLAAVAAAVIGPNLPGAGSVALVTWHGNGHGGPATGQGSTGPTASTPSGVQVSTLVQVAEQEVNETTALMFTVHSSVPTREVVAALDTFDGEKWTTSGILGGLGAAAPSTGSSAGGGAVAAPPAVATVLPQLSTSLSGDLSHPSAPVPAGPGRESVTQAIRLGLLAGHQVPAAGYATGVSGIGRVFRSGSASTLVASSSLPSGTLYAVRSVISDPSPAELSSFSFSSILSAGLSRFVALPAPVPASLVDLAHQVTSGDPTPYAAALSIETYLNSSRFTYQLPVQSLSGAVATPTPGYSQLETFLFKTRTGYCQQFATAFAVLARIVGLPVRIAVGFLPGTNSGHDTWVVDGADTHAWPQVLFGRYGWVDFEPTPGTQVAGVHNGATVPAVSKAVASKVKGSAHNLRQLPSNNPAALSVRNLHHARSVSSTIPYVLIVLAVLAAFFASVPLWRRLVVRRAARDEHAGVIAAWREALRTLSLAGVRRRRAETHLELARRVHTSGVLGEVGERALIDLAGLVTAACYASDRPAPGSSARALEDARAVRRGARRRVPRWQWALAELDPRPSRL